MIVTVYSKPACGGCVATKSTLDKNNIEYKSVDMSQDESALEAVKAMGYLGAPVVVVEKDGVQDSWSGFRPDRILALAAQ